MIFVRIFESIILLFIICISFYRLNKYKSMLKTEYENTSKFFKVINLIFILAGITALIALLFILSINKILYFDANINRILAIFMVVGWSGEALIIGFIEIIRKIKK